MTGLNCVVVEYRYRRVPIVNSTQWHLNCYKATDNHVTQFSGILDVSDSGGDQVSIFIAVPCDEHSAIDADTQAEYEELADQKFITLRPNAELA